MSESDNRQYGLRSSPRTRSRSGSEAIRKRVAQLMQVTTSGPGSIDRPTTSDRERKGSTSSHGNLLCEGRHKATAKDKPLPITPGQPRALKRKKSSGLVGSSDRHENGIHGSANVPRPSTSKQPSARLFDAMAYSPILDHDLTPTSSLNHQKGRAGSRSAMQDTSICANDDGHNMHLSECYRGPLAAAEYNRMKKEIETLKDALQDSRKASKRNQKKLDEAKLELNATLSRMKEKESQLENVKKDQKKSEEILATIESSVLCQICMDLPDQPFAISPCGHVLCLLCLQEWFRKAPPTSDDMDIDPDELTDPHYILTRSKSCPTCRAVIKRRPVPVFMVKAIASTLKKSKGQPTPEPATATSASTRGRQTEIDNPWAGIFPDSEESESEEHDSTDDYVAFDSDDFEDHVASLSYHGLQQLSVGGSIFAQINTSDSDDDEEEESAEEEEEEESAEEEEEEYEGSAYTLPRWSPPVVDILPGDRRLREGGADSLKLLQRGCNPGIIRTFDVSYSHHEGIVVSLPSLNQLYSFSSDSEDDSDMRVTHSEGPSRIFLGWNISLPGYDIDGELYLSEVLQDIRNRPERWSVFARPGMPGAKDARRLVRLDDIEAFDTTDSEVWADAEDF